MRNIRWQETEQGLPWAMFYSILWLFLRTTSKKWENCLGPSLSLLHWIDFLPRHKYVFSVRPLSHQQWSLVVLGIRTLSNISISRAWKKMESSNHKAVGLTLATTLRQLYHICLLVIETPKQLIQLTCFLVVRALFRQALPSLLKDVKTERLLAFPSLSLNLNMASFSVCVPGKRKGKFTANLLMSADSGLCSPACAHMCMHGCICS